MPSLSVVPSMAFGREARQWLALSGGRAWRQCQSAQKASSRGRVSGCSSSQRACLRGRGVALPALRAATVSSGAGETSRCMLGEMADDESSLAQAHAFIKCDFRDA